MISRQVMQSTIEGLAAIAHIDLYVLEPDGKLIAASNPPEQALTDEELQTVRAFVSSAADAQDVQDRQFFKVFDGDQLEYILMVHGSGEHTHLFGKMAAFQLSSLTVAYRERFDRDNFFKNLLLDNLLLVDIYSRAKKLHLAEGVKRLCFVIRPGGQRDPGAVEIVRDVVGLSGQDFVTEIDETDIIIVHEAAETEPADDEMAAAQALRSYALELAERLATAGLADVRISYGTASRDIRDVSRSYKEAKMALDVSHIFYEDARVICYSELGIGRLIYQLPLPLCRMFLSETFGECQPEDIDREIVETVDIFFENSLNVSETARNLFIHRNTLVYRLDKLQKITGLDVRIFEDAITYRIAMMVVKYMKYMEENSF